MNYKRTKDILLLASVFVTGAAVLIVEIIAIRILAPYYGNTIYTASSVISTILAALSLGYYLGGIVSDKYPEHGVFYGIIFVSGFLIIFIQFLNNAILPLFGLLFSISIGPLISSIFIFFIPAFSLGMLSPFAVKLHHVKYAKAVALPKAEQFNMVNKKEQDKVGSQSGEVFFWSTMGSIVGSLLSGFILIPNFGINSIIIGTGIIISIWGICGFLFFRSSSKSNNIIIFMILFFVSEIFFLWFYTPQKQNNVLYEKDGIYEKIKISDSQWNNQPARFLFLDKSQASAMYLDSDKMVFDYTKYYQLYKLFNLKYTSALVIGGGAYSIPKAFLNDSPEMQVDVSEIEPELFGLAQKYFNLQNNARLTNYTEDGRRLLSEKRKKYDIIVSDVYYSFFSIPIHFTTKEFFDLAKNRLNLDGVFIGNFTGDLNPQSPSLILSEIKTFKEVFPNSYFFAVDSALSKYPQNIIFLGINGQKKIDFESNEILKSSNPIIKNLPQKNIDISQFEFSRYLKITDNFSPIEYLIGKIINNWYR